MRIDVVERGQFTLYHEEIMTIFRDMIKDLRNQKSLIKILQDRIHILETKVAVEQ